MDEYEGDELASDEDNAKRIEKAKKAVETKALKRKRAANPRTSRQVQGRPQKAWEQLPAHEQRDHYSPQADWSRPTSRGRPPRVPGPCFHCGEMGHLRAMCPKLVKTYPFDDVKCVDKALRDCDKLEVNQQSVKMLSLVVKRDKRLK